MNEYLLSLVGFLVIATIGAALRAYASEYTYNGQFLQSLGLILYVAALAILVVGPIAFG